MAPPSLTNSTHFKYDVYLSFRGSDTRTTFVAHLEHAFKAQDIRVFIRKGGDGVDKALSRATEESKIFLIIFSVNYAWSRWRLDELAKIMELRETKQRLVIPVFYGLDPAELVHQKLSIGAALSKHRWSVEDFKVEGWSDVLRLLPDLSGCSSMDLSDDAALIQEIVTKIWKALAIGSPLQNSSVETGAVKSNFQVDEIKSLLQMGSSDVRIIGILGEGGIGKTTIVKELFRQIWDLFQRFYFFTNVKEEVKQNVVDHLRDKLRLGSLGDGSPNPEFGLEFRKDRVQRLKILLILDDVDDSTDIQELVANRKTWFGSGSRILITSRDDSVFQNLDAIYEVKRMNDYDSENLLRSTTLDRNYEYLFEFLQEVDGNPLAIKVLGSALREKNDSEWKSALQKLEEFPVSVYKVLRYSYDTLKEEEKKVFLDVACFFVGDNWDDVTKALDAYHSSIHATLRILLDRSLMSVSQEKLEMHDLLQEMAWTIVHEEVSAERGRRSNLWRPENLYRLLAQQKGWMMLGCSSSLCLFSL